MTRFDQAAPSWTGPVSDPPSARRARRAVFLHPGQISASTDAVATTTILGSCVAVFLFDAEARIGGANHFLLPKGAPPSARFAEHAIRSLVARLESLGGAPSRFVAKLFGGACVLEAFRAKSGQHLGAKNVEAARTLLTELSIPIVAEATGGHRGRKVIFFSDTGDVLVREI